MELVGERLIPAPISTTWNALNDPSFLKDCIGGCESLERLAPDTLSAVMAVKIGPVSAHFKGVLRMSNVEAPRSYTLAFDGQGGVAGFGRGTADVSLSEEGAHTRLRYKAKAQVGGRLAQVGSRLVDAAASKVADEFFSAFVARLQPMPVLTQSNASVQNSEQVARATMAAWRWWAVAAVVAAGLLVVMSM